jgi:hypothetical protein
MPNIKQLIAEDKNICSPMRAKEYARDGTCFSKLALIKMAEIWNKTNGKMLGNINNVRHKSKQKLWNDINDHMSKICKGSGREWCWVDKLGPAAKANSEIIKSVRPVKPREWYREKYAWLSNYDIQNVMRQYQDDKSNEYRFIGVFPIDFAMKTAFNSCLYEEICKLDINHLYSKKIRYLGMITNLDKHDEPGSHWTSLFMCIDPNMESFGAYYYDSTFDGYDKPPKEIIDFMKRMAIQGNQMTKSMGINRKFKIMYNKVRHQRKSSECGVFAIAFQIRWLHKLKENKTIVFDDIIKMKITDNDVHQLRNHVFRPNTKALLKEN